MRNVSLQVQQHQITAFIGPSGCGKSTMLRCFNRMNDLIDTARVEGDISYHGVDLYDPAVNPVEVRRRIGMVFQKPNPFPKSIYDNVAYGPKVAGVPRATWTTSWSGALQGAALWDEVKDRLKESGMSLSGGQQQRLCIARAIATDPEVLLMDEPCSALDPIATGRIEDLMVEIKERFTIIIVTHNMQQAARVSDRTAFFTTEVSEEGDRRTGLLVEFSDTDKIFTNPADERTENYVTGRFGLMRQSFQDELDQLRMQVELMGIKVDQNLERMRAVLVDGDDAAASAAVAGDDEIDAMDVSLTERCYDLLARENPVASDLRFIVSVLRILSELERIGDLALRVVKLAPERHRWAANQPTFDILVSMGDTAVAAFRDALRAWCAQDLGLATDLATRVRTMDAHEPRSPPSCSGCGATTPSRSPPPR